MPTYQGIYDHYTIKEPCRASGGEGEIFDIRGKNNLVLKRFTDRHRTTTRENKLKAMIHAGIPRHLLNQLTWPVDIVYENGRFIGYVMPALHKMKDLNEIYSMQSGLTLSDRLTVAMNLCIPVDGLHQLGQYVGDGNPENICVDPNTLLVTFVDTDSYTIHDRAGGRIYPCMVGLNQYLAPEVQNALHQYHSIPNLPPDTFNEYTDRFWLAVHIFSLLMNGTHPFAVRKGTQVSIPHMSVRQSSTTLPQPEANICSGFFPHTMKRSGLDIPMYCPGFSYLPASVQRLFIRAFADGHTNPAARPSAREWFAVLLQMQQSLTSGTLCRKKDHQYPASASFCPWCEIASRNVPKPPVHTTGNTASGSSGGGGGTAGGTPPSAGSGCLGLLGILLACLLSMAMLLALPAACTANLMDISKSEEKAREEAALQKLEELREEAESSQQMQNSQSTFYPQSDGPAGYGSGMQADGSWVHPHAGATLSVPSASSHNLTGVLSDLAPEKEYTMCPDLTGVYYLETICSEIELYIRIYDDTGFCLASYISETDGHGTAVELTGGQNYTVKAERRFADTGEFQLRWWKQKQMQDVTNYEFIQDAIAFSQQVNAYQFCCTSAGEYQVLCTQADAGLSLCLHIYDEAGNRLNSRVNTGAGTGPCAEMECGKTYYIHVNAYLGSGNYTLRMQQIH